MSTHHRPLLRLRAGPSRLAAAVAVALALPLAHAGPPVQYERISLIGQSMGGIVVSHQSFALGPNSRLFAYVGPAFVSGIEYSRGIYVRDDGNWNEIVPSRRVDLGEEWGANHPVIIAGDHIAVVGYKGWSPRLISIREYIETEEGHWVGAEVLQRPEGCWVSNIAYVNQEYRWVECDSSSEISLFQLTNGSPERILEMQDVLAELSHLQTSLNGQFTSIKNPDRFLLKINLSGIFGETHYFLKTLGGTQPMEFVAAYAWDDQADHGTAMHSMNRSGDLLFLNEIWDSTWTQESEIRWAPVGPSLTPAFQVSLGDGEGFDTIRGIPSYWAKPAMNETGRVLFNAFRSDGRMGLFVGPDPYTDAIWLDGTQVFGVEPFAVSAESVSETDQFVAQIGHADGSREFALVTICPADVNRDGIIDNGDIGAWVNLYLDGSMRTDFNNDGLLDNGDIGEFITQFLAGC